MCNLTRIAAQRLAGTATQAQNETLVATVTTNPPGTTIPGGTVTFLNGSTTLATVGLTNGTAEFSTTELPLGDDSLTAVYSGDGELLGSSTATVTAASIISTVTPLGTTTVGSAKNASLYFSRGVAVDGAGNLYIANADEDEINEVDVSTGVIKTIAGDGTAGYSGDGGLAIDAELTSRRPSR